MSKEPPIPVNLVVRNNDEEPNLAPNWATEALVEWTHFPEKKFHLTLGSKQLSGLPNDLFKIRRIECLDLSNNRITEVGNRIGQLAASGIKSINLSGNTINTISDEIKTLTTLEYIYLQNNQISNIHFLGTLSSLKEIDLSNNKIEEVPLSIGYIKQLRKLDLSSNLIKQLPATLFSKNSILTELNIANNQITVLPHTVMHLQHLTKLIVNNNKLSKLPVSLGLLPFLEEVNIENNPFDKQTLINQNQIYQKAPLVAYCRSILRSNEKTHALIYLQPDGPNNIIFQPSGTVLSAVCLEKLICYLTRIPSLGTTFYSFLLIWV